MSFCFLQLYLDCPFLFRKEKNEKKSAPATSRLTGRFRTVDRLDNAPEFISTGLEFWCEQRVNIID